MRILIVDENPGTLATLADFLTEHTDASVATADSPAAAVGEATATPPDALLTAVTFPGHPAGDGFDLANTLAGPQPGLHVAYTTTGDPAEFAGDLDGAEIFALAQLDGDRLLAWLRSADPAATKPLESDGLPEPGTRLGDYEIVRQTDLQENVVVYDAFQTVVSRKVGLVLLRPDRADDKAAVRSFRATVRAKAAVVHPHIAPVYEAHEEGGVLFYARERIVGKSLHRLAASNIHLKQDALLRIVRETAEAYAYLAERGIHTAPLTSSAVFVDKENATEISNLAIPVPHPSQSVQADLGALGQALAPLVDNTSLAHAEIDAIIKRLGGPTPTAQALTTWADVARAAQLAQRRLSDARSLHAPGTQGPAPAWRRAEAQRRRTKLIVTIASAVGAVLVGALVLKLLNGGGATTHGLDEMVRVPGGTFTYQDDPEAKLETFWVDAYEVTIGEYQEFLDHLASDPAAAAALAHPDQPAEKKSHVPDDWANVYAAASKGRRYRGTKTDVRCPVTGVDWWDAHAYAAWKGRRLPTEQEWEKAGRGRRGHLFPWGDDPDPTAANVAGEADGFPGWAPVDAHPQDITEVFAYGFGGNVSEWTASMTHHPTNPDLMVPVVRGASYTTSGDSARLTTRLGVTSPSERRATIGFRTVSDRSPL